MNRRLNSNCWSRARGLGLFGFGIGQDVTVGQTWSGLNVERVCLRVWWLFFVQQAQQARCIKKHQSPFSCVLAYSRARSASMLSLSAPVGCPKLTEPIHRAKCCSACLAASASEG